MHLGPTSATAMHPGITEIWEKEYTPSTPVSRRFQIPQFTPSGEWTTSSIHSDDIVLHCETSTPIIQPSSASEGETEDEEPNIVHTHTLLEEQQSLEEVDVPATAYGTDEDTPDEDNNKEREQDDNDPDRANITVHDALHSPTLPPGSPIEVDGVADDAEVNTAIHNAAECKFFLLRRVTITAHLHIYSISFLIYKFH